MAKKARKGISIRTQYEDFMKKNGWSYSNGNKCVSIMRAAIIKFMETHQNVAIYGYGKHTEQLMLDFVAELRNVKTIIDNYFDRNNSTGYTIIRESEIKQHNVDGIIVSVYVDRDKILGSLKNHYKDIDVLDFYSLFEEKDINVVGPYYRQGQGGAVYRAIDKLKKTHSSHTLENLREVVGLYCAIKDFMSAEQYAIVLYEKSKDIKDKEILSDIRAIHKCELELLDSVSDDTVYMLCIDGLRRRDLAEDGMPKLFRALQSKSVYYENAYSYSTSTYESLIPAYSENTDQRTRYFETSEVKKGECRFIEEAKKQNRKIVLNTGTGRYFDDEYVEYRQGVSTITEHIWDFVITAGQNDNLLYYSQPQCESHFPFYNPYTEEPVLDGTAILFDYLDKYGGILRTDYDAQHNDALKYMDDILAPIFSRLKCRFVVFSDHGSTVLKKDIEVEKVKHPYFGSSEDWIRIPLFIHNGIQKGSSNYLVSLLEINDIIIALLRSSNFVPRKRGYVKIGRSAIYNPDFRVVYKKANAEHYLLAFEGFVFEDGYKLIVYSDGTKELYNVECDEVINDDEIKEQLFNKIKSNVTVVEWERNHEKNTFYSRNI